MSQGEPGGKQDNNLWMSDTGGLPRAVLSRRGMVAAEHPLAAAAGLRMLQAGGNAVDAAISMAAATGVLLPMMSGLGGDAFMIIYEAATGKYYNISGSGNAPRGATRDFYASRGYQKMPLAGILAAAVPGAVSAYIRAWERFGTRSLGELFAPAMHYARDGFPVSVGLSHHMGLNRDKLRQFPASAAIFLRDGQPYRPGEILRQPDLADSLARVAQEGEEGFYRGDFAAAMLRSSEAAGGLFTREDLSEHRTEITEPLTTDYRGCTIYQNQPPSQGYMMLEMLNILEGYDLAALGAGSAAAVHLMVEAKKLAYADRVRYAGDARFVDFPLDRLLSKEYAAGRRQAIKPDQALPMSCFGVPEGDTTSFVAVDGYGNAVSFIHSLSLAFGCGVTVEGTGVLLNNRAGRGFNLEEGHPNCIAPGKKTMHTLNCYIVEREGKPLLVGGTMGGDGQPQWNVQTITNVLDFGLSLAEAVAAPRWTSFPGTDPANLDLALELWTENRLDPGTIAGLAARGHRMKVLGPWEGGGSVQIIQVDPLTGVLTGYSDPRSEGQALGY